jgi:hypothetical protein
MFKKIVYLKIILKRIMNKVLIKNKESNKNYQGKLKLLVIEKAN